MRVLSIDIGRQNMACVVLEPVEGAASPSVTFAKQARVDPSCRGVCAFFEDVPTALDAVVIERQPGCNVRMCRLQHFIEMMFHMRGVSPILFDPRKKLEFAHASPHWPAKTPFPKTYWQRKQAAIKCARAYLESTHQRVPAFEAATKQDDLADAIMQALAHMSHGA